MAQLGSAPVWGTGGREFKSRRPDIESPTRNPTRHASGTGGGLWQRAFRLETDRRTRFHLPLLSFAVADGFRGRTRFISTRRLRHRCLHPRWRFVCRCMGPPSIPSATGPPLSPTERSRPGGRIRPGRRAAAGSPPSHAIDLRTIDLRCAALLDEPRPSPGTPHQNPPTTNRGSARKSPLEIAGSWEC